jgi:ribosomal protein L16 Arg81 hydroxylase
MKTPKRSSVKLFVNNLQNMFNKLSENCEEFVINSSFNNKKIIISYSVKGGKDVQR